MKTRLQDYKERQKKPLETFSLLRWYKDIANTSKSFKTAQNGQNFDF
jgi:hypothetical protein